MNCSSVLDVIGDFINVHGLLPEKVHNNKSKPMKLIEFSGQRRRQFYARKQLLLSARLSHRNSVCLSVRPSVCHTGGSVKNGAS